LGRYCSDACKEKHARKRNMIRRGAEW
jgi:hypothetical protein